MKILMDKRAIDDVLEGLSLPYKILEKISVPGIVCKHEVGKEFYMECKGEHPEEELLIVQMDDESVWEVDKFLNPIEYKKEKFENFHTTVQDTVYMYQKRNRTSQQDITVSFEEIKRNKETGLQLNGSDIYLLIPGKLDKEKCAWEKVSPVENDFFQCFKTNIDRCVEEEYNSDFIKNLQRKCVAEVILQINDLTDHLQYRQKALVGMVKHETGFCVIEIMVPNCNIGGNKLLNYYCGDRLEILWEGKAFSIATFCEKLHVRMFGKKRSMAFVYSKAEKRELINALANEEFPMGIIGGDFAKKVEVQNIAQYDTAQVYVSHETMLEKCKYVENISENRLAYHAIEIFFVELILFQDAAIDKVYCDLNREEEYQRGYRDVQLATEKYEQLSFDMAQAIRFGDYEQFKFPTVRESAKNVAKNFGIDNIFEKYETNKELLNAMISANKRRLQEKQDNVKNQFLLIISALATVGTLGEIIYSVSSDTEKGLFSYIISGILVIGGYVIYMVTHFISQYIYKNFRKKGNKK